jgi:hypothetical protein
MLTEKRDGVPGARAEINDPIRLEAETGKIPGQNPDFVGREQSLAALR